MDVSKIKALTFDVFGTVVDWRSTIVSEGKKISEEKGIKVDWNKFADTWRSRYLSSTERVRRGELPWMKLDEINRMVLEDLLIEFEIIGLNEAEKDNLNRVWHRFKPWPDAINGLKRMRTKFIIATLSNGNMALLINMAKNAGLPWDCILSAELVKQYKMDPEAYLLAADLLNLKPDQILMVAAHKMDLQGAQKVGMRTAFVSRPLEFGPNPDVSLLQPKDEMKFTLDTDREDWIDLFANDFDDLASKLGT